MRNGSTWLGLALLAAVVATHVALGEMAGHLRGGRSYFISRAQNPTVFYGAIVLEVLLVIGIWRLARMSAKRREKVPVYPSDKRPLPPEPRWPPS